MKNDSPQLTIDEHIENAAFALWEEKGINNVSISAICHKANVSRSTFYRHFGSEKEIITSYLYSKFFFNKAPLKKEKRTNKELIKRQLFLLKDNLSRISAIYHSGYRNLLSEILWPELAALGKEGPSIFPENDYGKRFLLGGFILVFMAWAEGNEDPQGEEISAFFCQILGIEPDKERSIEEIASLSEKAKQIIYFSSSIIDNAGS